MLSKESIIEQINQSFNEYTGSNEAILDAAHYIEDDAKKQAIAFAEFTREAPGNTWIRADGEVLTTEQLFDKFKSK